jgi:Co/Zn/Cd efflux system component
MTNAQSADFAPDHGQADSHLSHSHVFLGAGHERNERRTWLVIWLRARMMVAAAAVSVMVISGLLLARSFGWLWMDPAAAMIGAAVIASWSYGLIQYTGAILLDRVPDHRMAAGVRKTLESDGDRLTDLHLWRLGPGHLGAIVSISTDKPRDPAFYRRRLPPFPVLSHATVEVQHV